MATKKSNKAETAAAPKKGVENASATPKAVSKKQVKASATVKVRITGPVAWLGYPWNIGQEVSVSVNQGQEMIDQNVAIKL
ncbi:hypothetical protein [Patiriisocius marinus]|uniref:hypothetical protein n=1 Tax=Patiriisocius marinus TaxID=1397112 RepID=UPI00232EE761|nr:hypothetical protein [Patiriisocius marinus]